jgi:putative peptidoglycan lipid II flippase
MMILVGITKIAGFLKLHLLARLFGASRELDVFWSASTLPDLIFWVVVAGSINAALIPVFAKLIKNKKKMDSKEEKFEYVFSQVVNLVVLISVFLGALVFIFAHPIANFMASGGLSGITPGGEGFSTEEIDLMVKLMRIMTVSPIIMGVSSVFSAGIQANKRFVIPAMAPLFYNLGILFGSLVFVVLFDWGIVGLSWSVVLGSVLHLLIQLPLAGKMELRFRFLADLWSEKIKKIFTLALPRVTALLGEQLNVVINTIISTRLVEGSLSAYKFGSSLYLLPVQLLGNTISQAALPTLSLEFKKCDRNDKECSLFVNTFLKSFQQILFLIMPAVIFILVLRLPIVRLSLGAGRFDWEDTVITSWVLALFSLAILGQCLHGLTIRVFYAMNETVIPLLVSLLGLLVSVAGSFLFTNFFSHYYDWRPIVVSLMQRPSGLYSEFWHDLGRWFTTSNSSIAAVGGLPLSIGVASMVEVIVLIFILNKKLPIFSWKKFWQPILRKIFAALVMFWVMYTLYKFWNFSLDTSTVISIFLLLTIIGGIGLIVYFGVSIVIDITEVNFFIRFIKKGIKKVRGVFEK